MKNLKKQVRRCVTRTNAVKPKTNNNLFRYHDWLSVKLEAVVPSTRHTDLIKHSNLPRAMAISPCVNIAGLLTSQHNWDWDAVVDSVNNICIALSVRTG